MNEVPEDRRTAHEEFIEPGKWDEEGPGSWTRQRMDESPGIKATVTWHQSGYVAFAECELSNQRMVPKASRVRRKQRDEAINDAWLLYEEARQWIREQVAPAEHGTP